MTPNKRILSTDADIHHAYSETLRELAGRTPFASEVINHLLVRTLRRFFENYTIVSYTPREKLGEVVMVTETNGLNSRFVNVAPNKWYCDGRPMGARFLSTHKLMLMSPVPVDS